MQDQFDDRIDEDDDLDEGPPSRVRLDKWLLAARFFKVKQLAIQACDAGKVTVNGERVKASREIVPGDRLTVQVGEFEWEVDVTHLTVHRGVGSMDGETLFEETDESQDRRAIVIANRTAPGSGGPAWARPGGGVSPANLPGGGGGARGGRGRERERDRERDRDRDRPRRGSGQGHTSGGNRGPRGGPKASGEAGAPAHAGEQRPPRQPAPAAAAAAGAPGAAGAGGVAGADAAAGAPGRKSRRRRRGRSGRARGPGEGAPGAVSGGGGGEGGGGGGGGEGGASGA